MTHVATLIAPEGSLPAQVLRVASDALPGAKPPTWLAPETAADIAFSPDRGFDKRQTEADLRRAAAPLDIVIQPAAARRKRLFLADMDSTMIRQECIDELADRAGLKPKIAAITERAMRGEIAFEPALRERVALLKGLSAAVIDQVLKDNIELMPGGRTLIATMRKNGTHTCLVSGGFTHFTDVIAKRTGFDEVRANRLKLDPDDHLAGLVEEPIFGRDGKRDTLVELRGRLGLGHEETMAIGDGANDIDMIEEAGLGVAFHAKPKVAAAAPARIDHGDLTALLYVQGYRNADFVVP
ncbi:MAG: phosphoserine phosphatase SerB [Pseudolabrys sp.]|nr:phosphoserine phosphatase SerB [Pseudolabrys sp.]MBV9956722.1 phosphoserine phosphatase SerB [Pseudolabrys sp.]